MTESVLGWLGVYPDFPSSSSLAVRYEAVNGVMVPALILGTQRLRDLSGANARHHRRPRRGSPLSPVSTRLALSWG